MIGRLNHIAIAVPDLDKATELYRTVMGAKVSAPKAQPAHGVTVVFVELPNTKIELLHPLGEKSPIANFLARNADGGIHHVCYEVEDIYAARDKLKAQGARVLGDGEPKIGAHDKPVLFLHPKDFTGTLIELEQVWSVRHELGDRSHGLSGDLVDGPVRHPAARRKRVENPGRGQEHGSPERPQLVRKAVITTIVAAVLWIGFYLPAPDGLLQLPRISSLK